MAFLKLDFGLMLNIFFMILSGLILGLTILMNNLQGASEFMLSHLFLFWEKRATRVVLIKNLSSHKASNKLTSIIYALALGCIIFLLVAADLQVQQLAALTTIPNSDITISKDIKWKVSFPELCDPVLIKHKDSIKSFAYTSHKMNYAEMNDRAMLY